MEFIQVKIAERMFENSLKKSNKKRYDEWMRIVNPGTVAKTSDYSKGDSALLSTTSVSENGPDKDGDHQRPSHSAHEKGTERVTGGDSQPLKEERLEAQLGLSSPGSMTECSAITATTVSAVSYGSYVDLYLPKSIFICLFIYLVLVCLFLSPFSLVMLQCWPKQ